MASDWHHRIHLGDCLDVMARMSDNSIDLIVTSPPYAQRRAHTYGGIKESEYVEWFLPRSLEMARLLTPPGSFVLNIKEHCIDGERSTYVLELITALRSQGWRWVEEYCWHKTASMPGKWKYRFRDGWERLLHFTREPVFKMRQDAVMVPCQPSTKRRVEGKRPKDELRVESASGSGFGARMAALRNRDMVYPSNVLYGAPVTYNTGHSAAFPEWLPEFFIKLFTDEGDVVLDPFSGSGTTYRVAKRLGRTPIGIEIDPEMSVLANSKLNSQPHLFDGRELRAVDQGVETSPLFDLGA